MRLQLQSLGSTAGAYVACRLVYRPVTRANHVPIPKPVLTDANWAPSWKASTRRQSPRGTLLGALSVRVRRFFGGASDLRPLDVRAAPIFLRRCGSYASAQLRLDCFYTSWFRLRRNPQPQSLCSPHKQRALNTTKHPLRRRRRASGTQPEKASKDSENNGPRPRKGPRPRQAHGHVRRGLSFEK